MVVDLPDTPEIVVASYKDEAIEDFEDHLEEEDDPKEHQNINEVMTEQQWDQEINEMIVEQQVE